MRWRPAPTGQPFKRCWEKEPPGNWGPSWQAAADGGRHVRAGPAAVGGRGNLVSTGLDLRFPELGEAGGSCAPFGKADNYTSIALRHRRAESAEGWRPI